MPFSPKAQLPWHRAQTASSPCIVFHHAERHEIAWGTPGFVKRIVKQFGRQMPALRYTCQAPPHERSAAIVAYKASLHIKRIARIPYMVNPLEPYSPCPRNSLTRRTCVPGQSHLRLTSTLSTSKRMSLMPRPRSSETTGASSSEIS